MSVFSRSGKWLCTVILAVLMGTTASYGWAQPVRGAAPIHVVAYRTESERRTGKLIAVVSFSVVDTLTADLIRFTIVMPDGVIRTFTARGRFSNGALIENRFLPADPVFSSLPLSRARRNCFVATFAHFVDGTTWSEGYERLS
ncbi:MAG: hypothetical protein WAJ85_05875 [Candidatus Baltobacteraceae bacterium]|jgi:hypothetical protein